MGGSAELGEHKVLAARDAKGLTKDIPPAVAMTAVVLDPRGRVVSPDEWATTKVPVHEALLDAPVNHEFGATRSGSPVGGPSSGSTGQLDERFAEHGDAERTAVVPQNTDVRRRLAVARDQAAPADTDLLRWIDAVDASLGDPAGVDAIQAAVVSLELIWTKIEATRSNQVPVYRVPVGLAIGQDIVDGLGISPIQRFPDQASHFVVASHGDAEKLWADGRPDGPSAERHRAGGHHRAGSALAPRRGDPVDLRGGDEHGPRPGRSTRPAAARHIDRGRQG